jgi:hypothetical protein
MNCKPGDLALVIASSVPETGRNIGKTVTCVRLLNESEHNIPRDFGPIWLVDRLMDRFDMSTGAVVPCPWACDRYLMPIRPPAEEVELQMALEDLNDLTIGAI